MSLGTVEEKSVDILSSLVTLTKIYISFSSYEIKLREADNLWIVDIEVAVSARELARLVRSILRSICLVLDCL